MVSVDLVIARYKENLSWVPKVLSDLKLERGFDVRLFIYNKGDDESLLPHEFQAQAEKLPNVGRESHAYLHHIIAHYDEYKAFDSDERRYVVFLQGGFLDHIRTFFPGYNGYSDLIKAFIEDAHQQGGASLKWAKRHQFGANGAHWNFRIASHNGKYLYPLCDQPLGPWFLKNVHNEFSGDGLEWWVAALFCVASDILTTRDKAYYSSLIQQLDHLDPEVGHYFERAWFYITGAYKLKKKQTTI